MTFLILFFHLSHFTPGQMPVHQGPQVIRHIDPMPPRSLSK